jgi:hypothetical protein
MQSRKSRGTNSASAHLRGEVSCGKVVHNHGPLCDSCPTCTTKGSFEISRRATDIAVVAYRGDLLDDVVRIEISMV